MSFSSFYPPFLIGLKIEKPDMGGHAGGKRIKYGATSVSGWNPRGKKHVDFACLQHVCQGPVFR